MTSPASPPSAFAFTSGARPEKLRLGDVLVRQQLITPAQLQQALTLQQQGGKKLGRVLVDSGILTEAQVRHVVGLLLDPKSPVNQ